MVHFISTIQRRSTWKLEHREQIILCQVACHPPSRPHQVPDLVSAFVDGLRLLKRGGADDDVIASVEEEMEATITQVRLLAPIFSVKKGGKAKQEKRLVDGGGMWSKDFRCEAYARRARRSSSSFPTISFAYFGIHSLKDTTLRRLTQVELATSREVSRRCRHRIRARPDTAKAVVCYESRRW
jgi:hypothetical protein